MSLQLSTAPTIEPVTLAEAKEHLVVEHSQDDAKISNLITAARQWVEQVTWRALISQTWKLRLKRFPCGALLLPKPPLQSVSSIAYLDADGNSQTWNSSKWITDIYSEPGFIQPAWGESYPATRGIANSVTVTFVAGYGATTDTVPEPIRTAIMQHVAHSYENRTPQITGQTVDDFRLHLESLLLPYKFQDERILEFV